MDFCLSIGMDCICSKNIYLEIHFSPTLRPRKQSVYVYMFLSLVSSSLSSSIYVISFVVLPSLALFVITKYVLIVLFNVVVMRAIYESSNANILI